MRSASVDVVDGPATVGRNLASRPHQPTTPTPERYLPLCRHPRVEQERVEAGVLGSDATLLVLDQQLDRDDALAGIRGLLRALVAYAALCNAGARERVEARTVGWVDERTPRTAICCADKRPGLPAAQEALLRRPRGSGVPELLR
jgi:hypothetical protein